MTASFDVTPRQTGESVAHRDRADAKPGCQVVDIASSPMKHAGFGHGDFSQLGVGQRCPSSASVALHPITGVVGGSAHPEVMRVYVKQDVVVLVKNMKPLWDGAVEDLIGDTVGQLAIPFVGEPTVAISTVTPSSPEPGSAIGRGVFWHDEAKGVKKTVDSLFFTSVSDWRASLGVSVAQKSVVVGPTKTMGNAVSLTPTHVAGSLRHEEMVSA